MQGRCNKRSIEKDIFYCQSLDRRVAHLKNFIPTKTGNQPSIS